MALDFSVVENVLHQAAQAQMGQILPQQRPKGAHFVHNEGNLGRHLLQKLARVLAEDQGDIAMGRKLPRKAQSHHIGATHFQPWQQNGYFLSSVHHKSPFHEFSEIGFEAVAAAHPLEGGEPTVSDSGGKGICEATFLK